MEIIDPFAGPSTPEEVPYRVSAGFRILARLALSCLGIRDLQQIIRGRPGQLARRVGDGDSYPNSDSCVSEASPLDTKRLTINTLRLHYCPSYVLLVRWGLYCQHNPDRSQ